MIRLGHLTCLTTEPERLLVEFGGGDPDRTYTQDELGDRLSSAVDALPDDHPLLVYLADELLPDGSGADDAHGADTGKPSP